MSNIEEEFTLWLNNQDKLLLSATPDALKIVRAAWDAAYQAGVTEGTQIAARSINAHAANVIGHAVGSDWFPDAEK